MKKNCLIIIVLLSSKLILKAQHDFDDQGIIYNNSNLIGIGTNQPTGKLEIASSNRQLKLTDTDPGGKQWTIGSSANTDLSFHYQEGLTDNFMDVLRINSNGYIGIGTPNPLSKLHLFSSVGSVIQQVEATSGSAVLKTVSPQTKQASLQFWENSIIKWHIYKSADANADLVFYSNNSERLRILQSNGNIGIGTSSPSGKLEINGANRQIKITDSDAGGKQWTIGSSANTDLSFHYQEGLADNIMDVLRIKANGNIGIGTTSPDYKLDVCGTIRAREVKVDLSGGCDFVFKSNYNLMDLKKLENFIKTNQHLPEIAPENEMVENGVNMKELQMKLLQKIEELTLYTIEQNKKIENLQNQINELKE